MKKFFLTFSLMTMVMTMMAIPAKKGLWSTIKLANGTEVRAQMVGDEHGHWMQAADGKCYVRGNEDVYELAELQTLVEKRNARMSARDAKRRAVYASTSDGLGQFGTMSRGAVPSIGEYTIPVVMVQFADVKFKSTTTVEKMKRYYNEEGYSDDGSAGSVRDYFKAQSGGMFVPNFDVLGIVTLSKNHTYYGKDQGKDIDIYLDELPGDVVSAAIDQLGVNFSQYVIPAGDEYHVQGVPLLVMFYAGKGEATEESGANYIWPCEWDDVEDANQGDYQNVHFNSFFVGNELYTGGRNQMGLGMFCHEFGHALGLPDFYVTDYSYSGDDAFGNWSVMDCGAYEGDSYAPIGYTAYEKSYMGWLDLKEVGDADDVTLQSPLGTAENSAYIIRNGSTETFIFENRQSGTWYPAKYGYGVLVSRIAYNYNQWNKNTLNNTKNKKRACVLTADGAKLDYSASSTNLYGGAKTAIATLKTLSGSAKTIGIKNIQKNDDGTIKLIFKEGTDPTPGPDPTPEGVVFYESFNQCDGTGGNDGKWSGTIASASFVADNEGWESAKPFGASMCAKFGTSDIDGSATTPSIALNGSATLTFKAGAWNAKNDGTSLTLTVTDGTVTPASFTMTKGAFQDYTATVTATGSTTITFTTSKGRFFLDEVQVKVTDVTGIQTMTEASQKANRIYTLDGRYVGTDMQLLPRGLYIVGGKKVVR